MRLQLSTAVSRSARPSALALVVATLALALPAHADESTGTWTGQLELRGNYYWETSTRVVAPEVRGTLVSPEGTSISAGYLVDAITSASQAAGLISDIRFTEVRNQVTLGLGQELDLGGAQLRLDAGGRVSHEPDYLATGIQGGGTLSLNDRATVVGLSLGYIHDDVGQVVRGVQPRDMGGGRDLSDRGRVGQLEGFSGSLSLNQVLSPEISVWLGYDLVHNWGYLQNPYRGVMVAGVLHPETHPDTRTRHSLHGRIAFFVPWTRSSLHLLYRAYVDDWDVGALTPEARLYQEVGDAITLRLRYRFYTQTRSFFYREAVAYTGLDEFVTADPKMSAFHSHLIGLQTRLTLRFFEGGPLDFLSETMIDLNFEYWTQTSRFGNGILAQVGIVAPF